jgi:hypothetical protein
MFREYLKSNEKIEVILYYQKIYNYKNFFETGTFQGKMIEGVSSHFEKIYSIELGKYFFEEARKKFDDSKVKLFWGDSSKILPFILKRIKTPIIFWLDAHFWPNSPFAKGETSCPIREELNAISTHPLVQQHVILIDDFRCFQGKMNYPTQNELIKQIEIQFPTHKIEIKDDIVRIIPS